MVSDPRQRALHLEARARLLEPDAPVRRQWLRAAADYAEAWLERLPELPGYVPDDESAAAALSARPIPEEPVGIDRVLMALGQGVDRVGVNESAGHFFGYIPGSGTYPGALGDYLAAVTNRYVGVRAAGPGAVRLERQVLSWIAGWLGYPETAGGDLTSGGSIATLTAIVTAREAAGVEPEDIRRTVVYLTEQTHHAVSKALRIAGLGRAACRVVPLDTNHRMRPDALGSAVQEDLRSGLRPWLLVTSAGTTDTGAVDPLDALADIAQAHGLWFHVDAAYGGAFALCEEGKRILAGIERSDSVVFDPHKGLFLPWGSGVVLVRDRDAMVRAHTYEASYLGDFAATRDDQDPSPADVSPELTRPFRGLRLWLTLQLAGVSAMRAAVEEKLWLARYFHQRLGELDPFEVGPPPDLSVVTFRWVPRGHDPNIANRRLVDALQADGRIYLSSTTIRGRLTLRLAILNARTHVEHVERALSVIQEVARRLAAPGDVPGDVPYGG